MKESDALKLIEKVASLANEDETNETLNQIYLIAHSNNPNNSCFNVHENWREKSAEINNELKDY